MTREELMQIAEIGGFCSDRACLNEKDAARASLVLVDGLKQADVASAEGVSRETVSKAVRRARRGAQRLGISI